MLIFCNINIFTVFLSKEMQSVKITDPNLLNSSHYLQYSDTV